MAILPIGAIVFAACSSNTSPTAGGLRLVTASCASSATLLGTRAIPVTEETTSNGPLVLVAMCIDQKGPYPFLVGTGVGTSVISPALKQSLGLKTTSPSALVLGTTCQITAPTTTVGTLSIAGLRLAPQAFLVAPVPPLDTGPAPVGIVGSDILARFGAIRVDYRTKELTVARPESPPPHGNSIILGSPNAGPPGELVKSGPAVGSVIDVAESPTSALASITVTVAGSKEPFILDSGSSSSSVVTATASKLRLAAGTPMASKAGVGCSGTASTYGSGSWSVQGTPLPTVSLVSQTYAGPSNQGAAGALGADVLRSYRSFVIDYGGAHLWLGVG